MSKPQKTGGELTTRRESSFGSEAGLADLIQHFLLAQDIKPSSNNLYRIGLKRFVVWLKEKEEREPTRQTILAYKADLNAKRFSALTISNYLVAVRRFFEWAEGIKLYPNIAKGIKGAKRPHGFRKDPLTVAQVKELLNDVDRSTLLGKRDFALINLLIRTGIRTIES